MLLAGPPRPPLCVSPHTQPLGPWWIGRARRPSRVSSITGAGHEGRPELKGKNFPQRARWVPGPPGEWRARLASTTASRRNVGIPGGSGRGAPTFTQSCAHRGAIRGTIFRPVGSRLSPPRSRLTSPFIHGLLVSTLLGLLRSRRRRRRRGRRGPERRRASYRTWSSPKSFARSASAASFRRFRSPGGRWSRRSRSAALSDLSSQPNPPGVPLSVRRPWSRSGSLSSRYRREPELSGACFWPHVRAKYPLET